MPRKARNSKDRLYVSASEHKEFYGGKRTGANAPKQPLPFDCCGLSFQPFTTAVCTRDGIVYELSNIIPWIKKHKCDPATGRKLRGKDLVRLHWHRNSKGDYHCPVTNRPFSKHSKIVAVATSGNVYSGEAVQQFNVNVNNMLDLIDSTPFTKADIIVIQDPKDPAVVERRLMTKFHHFGATGGGAAAGAGVRLTPSAAGIMKAVRAGADTEEVRARKAALAAGGGVVAEAITGQKEDESEWVDTRRGVKRGLERIAGSGANLTGGGAAGGFKLRSKQSVLDERWQMARTLKKKGLVRLHVSIAAGKHQGEEALEGDLNLELHCDIAPRTTDNFLQLCKSGYYDGLVFHRSIRNFMIQGGDPTGTGTGGESVWGGKFKDEVDGRLSHSGRGILSMANSGANTNGSQFFITYKSCKHLDRKHSIFGQLVGGAELLAAMEKVRVNEADRPKREVKIMHTTVFQDPFDEVEVKQSRLRAREEMASYREQLQRRERVIAGGGRAPPLPPAPSEETRCLARATDDGDEEEEEASGVRVPQIVEAADDPAQIGAAALAAVGGRQPATAAAAGGGGAGGAGSKRRVLGGAAAEERARELGIAAVEPERKKQKPRVVKRRGKAGLHPDAFGSFDSW